MCWCYVVSQRSRVRFPPSHTQSNITNIVQYNTIQYNTMRYNTIQYNTIQYNTIQYNTIQYNTTQYNTIQYNTIQYNTIQYNILYLKWLASKLVYRMSICYNCNIYIDSEHGPLKSRSSERRPCVVNKCK